MPMCPCYGYALAFENTQDQNVKDLVKSITRDQGCCWASIYPASTRTFSLFANSTSSSTIIFTSCSNPTFGFQPNTFFALLASPFRLSTSVGRKYLLSISTCSFQFNPTYINATSRNSSTVCESSVATT
ncbi:hypothetical protein H5410_008574 [Solanum commersonii]|uniref:Uncharacterized protein n=1 Tax=Solanum commersonii TaxID=4109 RepID=A0A9J6AGD9_SOLCO|nr:hypothetical protein H5410_008574 [Solanum commersonii]